MKLKIDNFAKIKKAEIDIDGITVIAGKNNTGKSTIGKILFSLFNSTFKIDDRVINQYHSKISSIIIEIFYSGNKKHSINFGDINRLIKDIGKTKSRIIDDNILKELIIKNIPDDVQNKDLIQKAIKEISKINVISDEKIKLEIISRYFSEVFSEQINNIFDIKSKSNIELTIKGEKMDLSFKNDKCVSFKSKFNIIHNAFYIDNPFIIDELSNGHNFTITGFPSLTGPIYSYSAIYENIISSLNKNNDILEGIFESVIAKDKLKEIYILLDKVLEGNIVKDKKDEFTLRFKDSDKTIFINNLSAGLKSFVIIKMLLEKGTLKEKDVLILDEPEIHLHPEWQILYAELIVLLEKYFNLSIIITTHSPYFLDAIDVYSSKHKINKRVNYYLSEADKDGKFSEMNDVTNNMELIYKKMASPIKLLDNLRYELKYKD